MDLYRKRSIIIGLDDTGVEVEVHLGRYNKNTIEQGNIIGWNKNSGLKKMIYTARKNVMFGHFFFQKVLMASFEIK